MCAQVSLIGSFVNRSWRMDYPVANPVPREMLKHTTKAVDPRFGYSHDDIVSFNTQASSQWDGLRKNLFDNANGRSLGSSTHSIILQRSPSCRHHGQKRPRTVGHRTFVTTEESNYRMVKIRWYCRTRCSLGLRRVCPAS